MAPKPAKPAGSGAGSNLVDRLFPVWSDSAAATDRGGVVASLEDLYQLCRVGHMCIVSAPTMAENPASCSQRAVHSILINSSALICKLTTRCQAFNCIKCRAI